MHSLPALYSLMLSQGSFIAAATVTQGLDSAHVRQKGPFWCSIFVHSPRILAAGQFSSDSLPAQPRHNLPLETSLLLATQPQNQDLTSSMLSVALQCHQWFARGCSSSALILRLLKNIILHLTKNNQPQPEYSPFPPSIKDLLSQTGRSEKQLNAISHQLFLLLPL